MRIGEIRQFCQLQLSTLVSHRTRSVKSIRTIADLVRNEEIQSTYLAEALRLRPPKDQVQRHMMG